MCNLFARARCSLYKCNRSRQGLRMLGKQEQAPIDSSHIRPRHRAETRAHHTPAQERPRARRSGLNTRARGGPEHQHGPLGAMAPLTRYLSPSGALYTGRVSHGQHGTQQHTKGVQKKASRNAVMRVMSPQ